MAEIEVDYEEEEEEDEVLGNNQLDEIDLAIKQEEELIDAEAAGTDDSVQEESAQSTQDAVAGADQSSDEKLVELKSTVKEEPEESHIQAGSGDYEEAYAELRLLATSHPPSKLYPFHIFRQLSKDVAASDVTLEKVGTTSKASVIVNGVTYECTEKNNQTAKQKLSSIVLSKVFRIPDADKLFQDFIAHTDEKKRKTRKRLHAGSSQSGDTPTKVTMEDLLKENFVLRAETDRLSAKLQAESAVYDKKVSQHLEKNARLEACWSRQPSVETVPNALDKLREFEIARNYRFTGHFPCELLVGESIAYACVKFDIYNFYGKGVSVADAKLEACSVAIDFLEKLSKNDKLLPPNICPPIVLYKCLGSPREMPFKYSKSGEGHVCTVTHEGQEYSVAGSTREEARNSAVLQCLQQAFNYTLMHSSVNHTETVVQ